MRIACAVEYDGARFHGWQRQQPGIRTVQAELERALARVAAVPVTVTCAGRTDAGVHASTQICHFDTSVTRSEKAWVMGANTALADDVSVCWARPVPDEFHARYSALGRRYRYVILEGWNRSALWRERAGWHHARLDERRMQDGAAYLLGEHDFSSFRSVACQASHPVRRLDSLTVKRRDTAIVIDVEGNAFLHNMVRIIAGVLTTIGCGERPPEWVADLLVARDRRQSGMTAPARGLYFVGPVYPAAFGLPESLPPAWPALRI